MSRLRLAQREEVRAFWRGHSEAWQLSGQTQREYCEQHGISLKCFGNWRAQLKREAIAGPRARWGHYPRLRHMVSHMAKSTSNHMAKKPASAPAASAPAPVSSPGGRREFSEDVKRLIVKETCQPGASVSAIARRYGIGLRLLFRWRRALGVEPPPDRTAFVSVQVRDESALTMNPVEGGGP